MTRKSSWIAMAKANAPWGGIITLRTDWSFPLPHSACTAWNIAVLPEHARDSALHFFVEEYKKQNPGIDDADDLIQNMRTLVKKKLQLFPTIKKSACKCVARTDRR